MEDSDSDRNSRRSIARDVLLGRDERLSEASRSSGAEDIAAIAALREAAATSRESGIALGGSPAFRALVVKIIAAKAQSQQKTLGNLLNSAPAKAARAVVEGIAEPFRDVAWLLLAGGDDGVYTGEIDIEASAFSGESTADEKSSGAADRAKQRDKLSQNSFRELERAIDEGDFVVDERTVSQIETDLRRSLPLENGESDEWLFDTEEGLEALRRVLVAHAVAAPEIGYCQGLNVRDDSKE